jgi:hypothetical protein
MRTTDLDILRDLMSGGRHSRTTVARCGVSLPTADRWLKQLAEKIPGVRKVREGTTTWYEWRPQFSKARVVLPPLARTKPVPE